MAKKKQTKRAAKSRARKAPKARKRKSTARKTPKRKSIKTKSRAGAARKPAARHFGRLIQAHKAATVVRSDGPFQWVDESAEGQWCYDRRDPKSTKLGEWKLKSWEQSGPYMC